MGKRTYAVISPRHRLRVQEAPAPETKGRIRGNLNAVVSLLFVGQPKTTDVQIINIEPPIIGREEKEEALLGERHG